MGNKKSKNDKKGLKKAVKKEKPMKKARGRPRKEKPVKKAKVKVIDKKALKKTQPLKIKAKGRGRPKKLVPEKNDTVTPKKRGRPRKTPEAISETPKRGRPKKIDSQKTIDPKAAAKPRGRPRKEAIVSQVLDLMPLKKRGRPKKDLKQSEKPIDKNIENEVLQQKKKRGRPKKLANDVKVESIASSKEPSNEVSKKRGRPRKEFVDPRPAAAPKEEAHQAEQATELKLNLTPDQLVKKHRSLVEALARLMTHVPAHIERDDLISEGYIGLIEASKRFDPTKGVKFETFARTRIQGAMYDWLRSLDLLPRSARDKLKRIESVEAQLSKELGRPANESEVSRELGVSLEDHQKSMTNLTYRFIPIDGTQTDNWSGSTLKMTDLRDESFKDPAEKIYATKLWGHIKDCLERFTERERLILSLMSIESLNLKEIGSILDYSPSTVRQMREKAIQELKEQLKVLRVAV